jgi:hypothetical protein
MSRNINPLTNEPYVITDWTEYNEICNRMTMKVVFIAAIVLASGIGIISGNQFSEKENKAQLKNTKHYYRIDRYRSY